MCGAPASQRYQPRRLVPDLNLCRSITEKVLDVLARSSSAPCVSQVSECWDLQRDHGLWPKACLFKPFGSVLRESMLNSPNIFFPAQGFNASMCTTKMNGVSGRNLLISFTLYTSSIFIVIILNETWLSLKIPSGGFSTNNYALFRSGREGAMAKNCCVRVLISVDESLNGRRHSDTETLTESLWVEHVGGIKNNMLISTSYLPPYITYTEFQPCFT